MKSGRTLPGYKRLSFREVLEGLRLDREAVERPRTRGDCENGQRPCPWISCRYNLAVDVLASGSLKLNAPGVADGDLDSLIATCALDVAEEGGVTLERVGEVLNCTRENVRLIETRALTRLFPKVTDAPTD